jgi:hypothetical protein
MASKELIVRSMPFSTGTSAPGAAVYCGDMDPASVVLSVGGTFSATVQLQGSLDKQVWFSLGGTLVSTSGVVNMSTDGTAKMLSAAWVRVATPSTFVSNTSAICTVAGTPKSL